MMRDERGAVTAETALAALAGALLLLGVSWGLGLGMAQLRAVDAAGAVARQEARGNHAAAETVREQIPGASVRVDRRDGLVTVRVVIPAKGLGPVLPDREMAAEASAVAEPGA